ncbi:response regulator [Pseudogemmobacter faecipullorum]|uniref:Response regulator n=1 Tax=Pseudogemmobacter faecipullorum TaxID=2755041 RepID=A0ABS8CKK3_9RHOB|nr:response regulator [Pseudogemmobacter faecipullorum]MCB5409929.1 response regulator [Pseudogemmobacter faecipullorum]
MQTDQADALSAQALSAAVAAELPYLRRYARALTGSQASGDNYAAAAIEAVLADPSVLGKGEAVKTGLFTVFHLVWQGSDSPVHEPDTRLSAAAQGHLSRLTPNAREALLLHMFEGFSFEQIGVILGVSASESEALTDTALGEVAQSVLGRVMIIEDEAIIALDLSAIVESLGHHVTGIARTRDEAVALAQSDRPDLILADIQLADNSSGVDAVSDILAGFTDLPVIFITAFPERLLTGQRPEPAFLINKPYSEEQVRLSISQALFFASTEPLAG